MKKTPTIFKRNPDNMRNLVNERNPLCDWVFKGEGVPTRKYDGSCCAIIDDVFYKRREIKPGKRSPDDFIQEDIDLITGKLFGWVPVTKATEDKWFIDALNNSGEVYEGTYEAIGPKFQGGAEREEQNILIRHSDAFKFDYVPTDFEELKNWFHLFDGEGIVWHHPDGRMAKIKKRDFK